MRPTGGDEPGLKDYLEIIWRRRLVVVASLIALVGVATLTATLRSPKYRAEATVLGRLAMSDRIRLLSSTKVSAPVIDRLLANEVVFAGSDVVAAAAAGAYGKAFAVTIEAGAASDTMVVSAVAASASAAAERANVYAETYIKARSAMMTAELTSALAVVEEEQAAIVGEIDGGADAGRFANRLLTLESEAGTYRSAMRQMRVSASPGSNWNQLVHAAKEPDHPFEPAWARTLMIAVLLGFTFGTGVVFVLEALDDTVHTERDAAAAVGVSALDARRRPAGARRAVRRPPLHPAPPLPASDRDPSLVGDPVGGDRSGADSEERPSELCLEIDSRLGDLASPRIIALAGARHPAGTSEVAVQLAFDLALLGRKVLLVDADHHASGRSSAALCGLGADEPGMGDALNAPQMGLPVHAERRSGLELFSVMTAGMRTPEPAELAVGGRFTQLLRRAAPHFDLVLIDVGPLVGVGNGPQIAACATATVVVAMAGSTTGRNLDAAAVRLRRAGGTILLSAVCKADEPFRSRWTSGRGRFLRHERAERIPPAAVPFDVGAAR